jgi:hypothetical protein
MEANKSKILFLHGYAQNSHIFNTRTKNLQKQLNKKFNNKFEYIFPDAPLVLDKEEQTVENEIIRGWLKYIKNKDTKFYDLNTVKYMGLEEAINAIFKIGDDNKNIEIIISFSQGTVILILLIILSLYKNSKYDFKQHFPNLKCLICVSGFFRPYPENEEFQDIANSVLNDDENSAKKIDIPMLDVYGINDQFVSNEKSKEITKFFETYEIFCHKGKHFVPSSKGDIIKFEDFIEKYLDKNTK